jgi:hypothetical protein
MNVILAFDIDGTLLTKEMDDEGEYMKGLIRTEELTALSEKGFSITIVSPSPFYPKNKDGIPMFQMFQEWGGDTMRWKNLADAENYFGKADLKLYISNNGDRKEAQKAGYIYVDVNEFRDMLDSSTKK